MVLFPEVTQATQPSVAYGRNRCLWNSSTDLFSWRSRCIHRCQASRRTPLGFPTSQERSQKVQMLKTDTVTTIWPILRHQLVISCGPPLRYLQTIGKRSSFVQRSWLCSEHSFLVQSYNIIQPCYSSWWTKWCTTWQLDNLIMPLQGVIICQKWFRTMSINSNCPP